MVIDSKGRLFGKISVIDIAIVLVLIAAVAFVDYRLTRSRTFSPFAQGENIEITFYGAEAPEYAAKAIDVGEVVRDPAKNVEFGDVTKIDVGQSDSYANTDKGEWVKTPKPGYSSVYITVSGKGTYGKDGVTFGGTAYFVGNTLEIKVGNAAFWTRIYSINKKE